MRLFFLFLFPYLISAQDTIRLKDRSIEVGKVLEIGLQEIRYTRINLDGPVFVRHKAEIDYIRFENGEVQKFKDTYPIHDPVATTPMPFQKILIKKRTLYYNGESVNEDDLLTLISAHPDLTKRDRLKREFSIMKGFKQQQYWWGTAGPITAGVIFLGCTFYSVLALDDRVFMRGAFISSVILVATITASVFAKRQRTKQFLRIAQLYNAP